MKNGLLILLIGLLVMPACRRGDEDPVISIRTRKNRLTGYWQLESYALSKNFGTISEESYDPEVEEKTITFSDSSEVVRAYSWEVEFFVDGTYTSFEEERFQVDSLDTVYTYTQNRTEEGEWEFTGGNGEPRKSQLLLLPSEISITRTDQGSNIDIYTIDGQTDGVVYDILRLSNDELWLTYETTVSLAFDQQVESFDARFVKLPDGAPEE